MPGGDVASTAAGMTPYASAAVTAYVAAVLAEVRDDVGGATAGLGRRLLQEVPATTASKCRCQRP